MGLPAHLPGRHRLVEELRGVVGDSRGEHEALQGAGGHAGAGELLDGLQQTVVTAQPPGHGLPPGEEDRQVTRRHRLQLGAQPGERAALEATQHPRVAHVVAVLVGPAQFQGTQRTLHQSTRRDETGDRRARDPLRQVETGGCRRGRERSASRGEPGQERRDRVVADVEKRLRDADGQRDPECVPQPAGVFDDGPHRAAGDADLDEATRPLELGQPALDVRGGLGSGAGGDLGGGQGPQPAQHVGDVFGAAAAPLVGEVLQFGLDVEHGLRVEQVAHERAVGTEQLGEQPRIQRECRGPALGQRGVTLVEELRHVAEHEAAGERRRRRGLHVGDLHAARLDVAQQRAQPGHVVDVLKALPDRLQHHRELRIPGGDLQQVHRALPLLPQRLATARVTTRQQEGAGRALTEPGCEQRRAADLPGHQLGDLVGRWQDRFREPSRPLVVTAVVDVDVRQVEHDPVVAVHDLDVDVEPLAQPRADDQRPRGVHLRSVRGVQDDPPVAEFVAETLEHQVPVVGHPSGAVRLLAQIREQVVGRPLVEAGVGETGPGALVGGGRQLPHESADGAAEFAAATDPVTAPERQPAGRARRRGDQHPVVGDLLDSPRGGAEREDVTDPGFVDHLLVEFADASAGAPASGEEDAEEPAVRDRAAAGDREP